MLQIYLGISRNKNKIRSSLNKKETKWQTKKFFMDKDILKTPLTDFSKNKFSSFHPK